MSCFYSQLEPRIANLFFTFNGRAAHPSNYVASGRELLQLVHVLALLCIVAGIIQLLEGESVGWSASFRRECCGLVVQFVRQDANSGDSVSGGAQDVSN